MVYEGEFWCLCTVTFWQKLYFWISNAYSIVKDSSADLEIGFELELRFKMKTLN